MGARAKQSHLPPGCPPTLQRAQPVRSQTRARPVREPIPRAEGNQPHSRQEGRRARERPQVARRRGTLSEDSICQLSEGVTW